MPPKNSRDSSQRHPLRAGSNRRRQQQQQQPQRSKSAAVAAPAPRRKQSALKASSPAARQRAAPTSRWLNARLAKLLLGLALLPVCWVVTQTFFASFSRAATAHRFWATEEFWFFALGALLWLIAFFGLPRPVVLYVFGHEATHALWVWACGGKVSGFRVGRDGGYVIADRVNAGISLAPYFFPLYSLLVLALWGALVLAGVDVWGWRCVLAGWELWPGRWLGFALIGATWAFHFTFTCWMIPKDQPDLRTHGTFFSLVVIYLANLLVLASFFIVACPQITWVGFGHDLLGNAASFVAWVRGVFTW
ncbi:MAG: hypothetical protein JO295_01980 [Verrucomicrobia bacterium]|nr:hypothetical protein [Verrucomicrobiota bacterium]